MKGIIIWSVFARWFLTELCLYIEYEWKYYYNNTNLDENNPGLKFFRITCDVSRRRLTTLSVGTTSSTSSQTLKTFGRRTPCGRCQRGSSHVVKKWANDTGLKSCCSQQLDIEFHKKGHCKQSNKFFHSV